MKPTKQVIGDGISPSHSYCNVPKLLVTNTRSLVAKIDEMQEFLLRVQVVMAFISLTWLRESIADSAVNIPGYNIMRSN